MNSRSRFADSHGILFAADLSTREDLFPCLDMVSPHIDAIKLGNSLLYSSGPRLVTELRARYERPVFADLKLTDVSHIASRVAEQFSEAGADVIVVAGICGRDVIRDVVKVCGGETEVWAFTEFTNDTGLIEPDLADTTIGNALQSGVKGFQVPGTRPHRVEQVRDEVGSSVAIMACGLGVQGGVYGGAVAAGANFEIIGRAIYMDQEPSKAAARIKGMITAQVNRTAQNSEQSLTVLNKRS
jgi:orotidine-5'-phosphate decarboxylase